MSRYPIGIFDSGVGGASVWKEIHKILPRESTIYLADSKHAPYGEKSKDEIIRLSEKNTGLLIKKGCKLIVVACNTATTAAIGYLRENYGIPFIGIEPAVKPAAVQSRTGSVGILATKGTLGSDLFQKTSELYGSGIAVTERVGDGLVSLIEQGNTAGPEIRRLLETYLKPMIDKNIDRLVLGCTHYAYLIPEIRKILPESVAIINSAPAVARQTKAVLEKNGLLNPSDAGAAHRFYSNLDARLLSRFLVDVKAKITVDYLDF